MTTTLNDPSKLAKLIFDLEKAIEKTTKETEILTSAGTEKKEGLSWKVVITPLSDYRELLKLLVIPTQYINNAIIHKHERDHWAKEIVMAIESSPDVQAEDVTLITVINPGTKPHEVSRFSAQRMRFRFVSAVEHLWGDRLGIGDLEANMQERRKKRSKILTDLSINWENSDERHFVRPAISSIEEDDLSKEAEQRLVAKEPGILDKGLTILYGPGGIGKTHFMRRLAGKYTKRCIRDDLIHGIPVFAVLPPVLHENALETFLSTKEGLCNLPLEQIRILIQHQVIIPFLDAFDELVRGTTERNGCEDFLVAIGKLMAGDGVGILTSRDYFLHVDPIIPSSLCEFEVAQVGLGFFNKQGRHSFILNKTGLGSDIVSRWSRSLEKQVQELFGSESNHSEIDGLVGHPLFMEALCNYISSIPQEEVANAAMNFQFRTPSIFGEIITRVLEREYNKARFGWQEKFGDMFVDDWRYGPFSPEQQLKVLTFLSCCVAKHGSEITKKKQGKDWIHGLFKYHIEDKIEGLNLQKISDRKEALRRILRDSEGILGDPPFATSVTASDATTLRMQAEMEIAQFYLLHVLSDAEPNSPDGLVFATRNKAYFEYFLAQELVNKVHDALESGDATKIVDWSDEHYIFSDFQDALQFVLWDHRVTTEGYEKLSNIFAGEIASDDTIASYCISLGLALALLRSSAGNQVVSLRDLSLAPDPQWKLELLSELLPAISLVNLETVSIPFFTIHEARLHKIRLANCDFKQLKLVGCKVYEVEFKDVTCSSIHLEGEVTFHECFLQISDIEHLEIKGTVHFTSCHISESLSQALQGEVGVRTENCEYIPDEDSGIELAGLSKGSRFLHKLMSLLRKHGKSTWGVFIHKLRGKSGIERNFDEVLDFLSARKIITVEQETVILNPEIETYMFDGKRRDGMRTIDDYPEFWTPIVNGINHILNEL